VVVEKVYNNNNKYHLFSKIRVSSISKITLRENANSKGTFHHKEGSILVSLYFLGKMESIMKYLKKDSYNIE